MTTTAKQPSVGYRETTISFDYERREVEFYFTHEQPYQTCLKRNPKTLIREELKTGFRLVYAMDQVRSPQQCLKLPVTEEQQARRREMGKRLAAA
jgi:hypothetical protein